MSTKRRYIQEANLISEQRYINNKFLMETEDPTTPEVQTSTDVAQLGVNVNDATTHQSILQQLEPYKDKVNMEYLKQNVGKPNFFDVLGNYMKFDLEKDSKLETSLLPSQTKTTTGEEATFKLGNLSLKGTFDFKDNQIGDIGVGYKTKIGSQPVTLMAKVKDPASTFSGNIKPDKLQVGVEMPIQYKDKNKSHGAML